MDAGFLFEPTPEYTAGLFDGEGCVRVQKHKARKPTHSPYYELRVTISNTNVEILNQLVQEFGGSIQVANVARENRKAVHYWYAAGRTAQAFLARIAPFVFIKRTQVDCVLTSIAIDENLRDQLVNLK